MSVALLIAFDGALAALGLYGVFFARLGHTEASWVIQQQQTILTLIIFITVVLFSSHFMEAYDYDRNISKRNIAINCFLSAICTFAVLTVVAYIRGELLPDHTTLACATLLTAGLQFCWHSMYVSGINHPRLCRRVLVLGNGRLAAEVCAMAADNLKNYLLAGFVYCGETETADHESGQIPQQAKGLVLGSYNELPALTQKHAIDVIVVALSERRGIFPIKEALTCKLNGIRIMDAPTFYELIHERLMLESITPSWFIYSDGFRQSSFFDVMKRGVDIASSVCGLLLLAPVIPLIALAIKLDSPGPVFYRQTRVGRREQNFLLYKFRTMRQDAEQASGAVWASKNDSRVTRLGNLFRSSRIDEIPQLFNVLKGDMSLIGPRPERPEFVEDLKKVIPYYSKRHFIKPGATGWAQVRYPYGASVEDTIEKLRYDLYYIKNKSAFLDAYIFLETIKVVFFGRGGR